MNSLQKRGIPIAHKNQWQPDAELKLAGTDAAENIMPKAED